MLHLVKDRITPMARWIDQLKARRHGNVAAVAMANKLARIAWAVLTKKQRFDQAALWAPDLRSQEVNQQPLSADDLMRHKTRLPHLGQRRTTKASLKGRIQSTLLMSLISCATPNQQAAPRRADRFHPQFFNTGGLTDDQ